MYIIIYLAKILTDARKFELQQPFGCRECRISNNIHRLIFYMLEKGGGTDARRFELQQTCGFAESDESPIYNIVYSTKIRISIDGREEIRTPGSKKNS